MTSNKFISRPDYQEQRYENNNRVNLIQENSYVFTSGQRNNYKAKKIATNEYSYQQGGGMGTETDYTGKKQSYGRIIEDTPNCRIYESGYKTVGTNIKQEILNGNQYSPLIIANRRINRNINIMRNSCPRCNGIIPEQKLKIFTSENSCARIRNLNNRCFYLEPVPGAKQKIIKTLVNSPSDECLLRSSTPTFTFRSSIPHRYEYKNNISSLRNSRSSIMIKSLPRSVSAPRLTKIYYYEPRCYHFIRHTCC